MGVGRGVRKKHPTHKWTQDRTTYPWATSAGGATGAEAGRATAAAGAAAEAGVAAGVAAAFAGAPPGAADAAGLRCRGSTGAGAGSSAR